MAFDDAMHHRKPQASASPLLLGSEVGIENLIHDLLIHAMAGVTDGEFDVWSGNQILKLGCGLLIQIFFQEGDLQDSAVFVS